MYLAWDIPAFVIRVLAKARYRGAGRSVKPANKVGAINYKEPATYKRFVVQYVLSNSPPTGNGS